MQVISEYAKTPQKYVLVRGRTREDDVWHRERVRLSPKEKMVMAIVKEGDKLVTRHMIVPS